MIHGTNCWGWLSWPLVRAHLCTLAVSLTFNATWRVPSEGFRFGGVPYGLALTVALLLVALPMTLLQLAIGQLSQQDAVGIWRAVPFFRGVGYIRLLISLLGSVYTMVYLALAVAYFLYTASHDIPFTDCIHLIEYEEEYVNVVNASECLSITFMSPINQSPEYYLAVALVVAVLWIASPFVFYSSVKLMKRIMYVLAPIIIILSVVIMSCIGRGGGLRSMVERGHWRGYLEPQVWLSAVTQALWSSQVAGGYLIAAGDSVYASTSVQWSSIVITCTNIVSSWFWLIVWYSITSGHEDTSAVAVLVQMYQSALDRELGQAWPLLVYLVLIFSGVVTMLVLLYPIYDRLRRIGGIKWRLAAFGCSLVGAGLSLAVLAGRLAVLELVENLAVPLLVSVATVLEILALGLIYGWRHLIEDVEFLISSPLLKYWVWSWWVAPALITPITTWWLTVIIISLVEESELTESVLLGLPEAITLLVTAVTAVAIIMLCAAISVGRQVQYDISEKLKSSFRPSRHWGPRDPITHYYWLARREALDRGYVPQTRYNRRELGQLSRRISFLTSTSGQSKSDLNVIDNESKFDIKLRSNSDDWLYRTGRKECIDTSRNYEKRRSKSLDFDIPRHSLKSREISVESNNNIVLPGPIRIKYLF